MFKKNQKLAGLWLAGEVVNHVGIYGSKAAGGLLVFQRRSFKYSYRIFFVFLDKIVTHLPAFACLVVYCE